MSYIQAIIIAIVEGITEFLPISSTGHMIITQKLLGMEITPFVKAFTVNIQFGAILSVIVLYWRKFFIINSKAELTYPSPNVFLRKIQRFILTFEFYFKLRNNFV